MCIGIGIDLCDIDRMESLLYDNAFLKRCFTDRELNYIYERKRMAAQSLAANFSAKEAFLKAIGKGLSMSLTETEILHNDDGQPYYVFHGNTAEIMKHFSALLSLTHEGNMAAAVCIVEDKSKD